MITTKSDFFSRAALRRQTVTVDSLGADVEIVELDLSSRALLRNLSKEGKTDDLGVMVLKACVPFLMSATDAEIAEISPAVVEEITTAAFALSGLGGDEEAIKN